MVVAAIIHPPRFGGVATKIDASAARAVKGFLDAKIIPQGVVVYATGTWPAFKAKGLVKVEWDEAKAEKRGTPELLAEYRKLVATRAWSRPARATLTLRSPRRRKPSRLNLSSPTSLTRPWSR